MVSRLLLFLSRHYRRWTHSLIQISTHQDTKARNSIQPPLLEKQPAWKA
jgi:hypothetical protein